MRAFFCFAAQKDKGGSAIGRVMTVLGEVEAAALGKTLSHEHIFCDFTTFLLEPQNEAERALLEAPVTLDNLWIMRTNPYANRDNCRLDDEELAVREVGYFKEAGGGAITEVSLPGSGRDPVRLASVARRTGVHILCATGHYIGPTLPPLVHQSTSEQLAALYLREINDGIDGTGIRPGIIGEIGTSYTLEPDEVKVLHGAAMAQRESGLALSVHLDPGALRGHEVLDILIKEEGVPPEKIILCHTEFALAHQALAEGEGLAYILSLANRGCYIEFELCGNTTVYKKPKGFWVLPTDFQRTRAIAKLCLCGFADRVLLSHDQGIKHFLRSYGGWGYAHVITAFQEYLAEAGIEPQVAKRFTGDNPQRVLSIG